MTAAIVAALAVAVFFGSMLATSIATWRRRNRRYWTGRW